METTRTLSAAQISARYYIQPVGANGRYGVLDRQTGRLVPFHAEGRRRKFSSGDRAAKGANTLNGWAVYTAVGT